MKYRTRNSTLQPVTSNVVSSTCQRVPLGLVKDNKTNICHDKRNYRIRNLLPIVLTINLENLEAEANNARFIVHAVQLVPELNCKAGMEFYKLIDLHEHPNAPLAFAVKVRTIWLRLS